MSRLMCAKADCVPKLLCAKAAVCQDCCVLLEIPMNTNQGTHLTSGLLKDAPLEKLILGLVSPSGCLISLL